MVLQSLTGNCWIPTAEVMWFFFSEHSNKDRVGLSKENLLLRGCTVRNTEAVVGIVVYAG